MIRDSESISRLISTKDGIRYDGMTELVQLWDVYVAFAVVRTAVALWLHLCYSVVTFNTMSTGTIEWYWIQLHDDMGLSSMHRNGQAKPLTMESAT